MGRGSDPRKALASLFHCVQSTFEKYDRSARRRAWDSLTTGRGKEQVQRLINNPSYQVVGIEGMLRFKEWVRSTSNAASS